MGVEGTSALADGQAFVDLSLWRKIAVSGSDAVGWLNDLVTNRVDDLHPQEARRSLLLSRTGHVRADFHVAPLQVGRILLQDPVQGPLLAMLEPFVLSSDVTLEDRSDALRLYAVGRRAAGWTFEPFPFEGLAGVLTERGSPDGPAAPEVDLEIARIQLGLPRLGVDVGEDALPAEAGWDHLIDPTKGCFLGQEAVAKVRNLGHPTRVVLSFRSDTPPRPGDPVLEGNREVGRVTGVAPDTDGYAVLARVAWAAREASLRTGAGAMLAPRPR